ncbi:hypothetical protein GQ53DRAFT_740169 [Thozetella sp. PMI_491]|nr:hypothetical protein GQ53DRAFT_740169 [Thozetella sp. PMI_491]
MASGAMAGTLLSDTASAYHRPHTSWVSRSIKVRALVTGLPHQYHHHEIACTVLYLGLPELASPSHGRRVAQKCVAQPLPEGPAGVPPTSPTPAPVEGGARWSP